LPNAIWLDANPASARFFDPPPALRPQGVPLTRSAQEHGMDPQRLGMFMLANLVFLLTPCQVMAVLVQNTMRGGKRYGLITYAGVAFGDVVLVTAAVLALIWSAAQALAGFWYVSLAGAAYLVWLAVDTLTGNAVDAGDQLSGRWPFLDGLAISISSPASILFYFAFLPQFVDPALPQARQLVLLGILQIVMGIAVEVALILGLARLGQGGAKFGFAAFGRRAAAVLYLVIACVSIFGLSRGDTP
jgi:homoserine/homoserine lactone efflux protein